MKEIISETKSDKELQSLRELLGATKRKLPMHLAKETPHSTIKVPPAKLLFLHSRTSGLSEIEELNFEKLKSLHESARSNDAKAKEQMKREYDRRMRVREPEIEIGAKVLLKVEQTRKASPKWDPQTYTVSLPKPPTNAIKPTTTPTQPQHTAEQESKPSQSSSPSNQVQSANQSVGHQTKRKRGRPPKEGCSQVAETSPLRQPDSNQPRRSERLRAKP
ncbi:hypothetical protein BpHYR1_031281 [Brachionus plicatilis]|uniref:Retrovirus-related Pol poly from transposon n=1 Tax=Brachionus plicatilis TaxID=10195 RepID=A0A3M7T1G8_BRAPC|nr:hypothetical protein BpHYR1_031281 [Brachionus plicatilis]